MSDCYRDCCHGFVLGCLIPCAACRTGPLHHTCATDDDQAHVLQPATPKTKPDEHYACAVDKQSPSHRKSAQQAHQYLLSHLDSFPDARQIAALSRLRVAFSVAKEHLNPDSFNSVIADLDTVLFNGCLSDKMIINWAEMPATSRCILRGICLPQGVDHSGITKVCIPLNKAMLRLEPKEEIWGTIVHEVLHAYICLESGWSGSMPPHHGASFERSCAALVERLALDGLEVRHVL